MASKSKKRRKVLAASCILAAMIIAGSTFAWFTSKDEVTNRLTANSDYGVSIVESFAPPANWLPGQTVNKDVYAVNTGNVAAFVKENVTGVLNYTYESKVNTWDSNCIKLTNDQVTAIDGVTTNEGGGFLAWTDAEGVTVGAVNSARTGDNVANTWHPTVEGTYIFRRSITPGGAAPTYTYAGYYYKGGNYYKIVIGNDNYRAESETAGDPKSVVFDLATPEAAIDGITINRADGSFTGTPKISYVKDTVKKDQKVTFTYEANSGAPRLKVEFAADAPTTTIDGVEYDASALAARTEVDYYNKLGESNKNTVIYEQAEADDTYQKTLREQTLALISAAAARKGTAAGKATADSNLDTSWEALKSAANTAIGTYNSSKGQFKKVDELFTGNQLATINSDSDLTECKANVQKMRDLETDIINLDGELWTEIQKISEATEKLTPNQVEVIQSNVQAKLDSIKTKINAYKDAYSLIVDDNATATKLNLSAESTSYKSTLAGIATALDGLKDDMSSAVTDYRTKYEAQAWAAALDTAAQTTWEAAIDTYNSKVSAAKTKYYAAVNKTAPTRQPADRADYQNNAGTIVPKYSANRVENGTNPMIDKETEKNNYGAIATWSLDALEDYDVATKKTIMDTSLAETKTAKGKYDDAKNNLNASSKITIYVNLDANYANAWQMDENTDKSQNVSFYLKSILEGGKTTAKLIDSVTFADTVSAKDYKDLTFDLNVGLDSAQITYAEDQRTIKTDATAGDAFRLKPALTTPTDINTEVTWAMPAT